MAVLNGNDITFVAATTSTEADKDLFAHATSCTLSVSNSTIETTTKDSSSWMEIISGKKSYTISVDGLVDYATITNQHNIVSIADLAVDNTLIYFTVSDSNGTPHRFTGSGYLTSLELTAPTDDVATYSVTLSGTGALVNPTQN